MYPALPADYPANTPPESCSDRSRRQAVSEVQTKPAVHCTDPAAPRALPRHLPKLNRSFPAVCFIQTRQPTKIEGRSGRGVPSVGGLVCSRLSVAIALPAREKACVQ